jgi:hypothetical protein
MKFRMPNLLEFINVQADEQLAYESFKTYIEENIDDYQELTLIQLRDAINNGVSMLNLAPERYNMLFDYVINSVNTKKG